MLVKHIEKVYKVLIFHQKNLILSTCFLLGKALKKIIEIQQTKTVNISLI